MQLKTLSSNINLYLSQNESLFITMNDFFIQFTDNEKYFKRTFSNCNSVVLKQYHKYKIIKSLYLVTMIRYGRILFFFKKYYTKLEIFNKKNSKD